MAAPTEAEIRAAVDYRLHGWEADRPLRTIEDAIDTAANMLTSLPPEDDDDPSPDDLWVDLRPSEIARLAEIRRLMVARTTARVTEILVDELAAAALQFGAEYPDAPRAERTVAA